MSVVAVTAVMEEVRINVVYNVFLYKDKAIPLLPLICYK